MWHLLAQQGPSGFQATFDKLARTPLSQILIFAAIVTGLRLIIYPIIRNSLPHRRTGSFAFIRFSNELLDAFAYAAIVVFFLIRPYGIQTFTIPTGSMLETLQINDLLIANKAIFRYTNPKRGDIVVFKPPEYALDSHQKDVDYIKRVVGVPGDLIEVKGGQLHRNGEAISEPFLADQFINSDWKLVQYQGSHAPWSGRFIPVTYADMGFEAIANYHTPTSREFAIGAVTTNPEYQLFSIPREWKMRQDLSAKENRMMQELLEAKPAPIPPGHLLMMGDNRNNSFDGRGWGLIPYESVVGRSEVIIVPFSRWRVTR